MATPSRTGPDRRPAALAVADTEDAAARSQAGWSDVGAGDDGDDGNDGAGDAASSPVVDGHPFAVPATARYRALAEAGAGGMGVVTVVHDRRLDRQLARKQIAPGHDDAAAVARLAREAQVTAHLDHPGVVAIYDAGLDAEGRPFYTMRLVRGRTLAEVLADEPGPRPSMRLLRHLLAACEAMAYAHDRAVIHRDLKPGNVMIGAFGETQLVDWGLARRLDRAADGPATSGSGTPRYMSPERARGDADDRRGDVWALGAILYEVVTGQPLVAATDAASIRTRLRTGPPLAPVWPPAAPPELRAVIGRALAWEPAARYADAGELAAEVRRFLDGRRVLSHEYSTIELARRLWRAGRWQLALGATALIALATTVAWRRIEAQRHRAVIAEHATATALAQAHHALGELFALRAEAALAAGATAEAEVLAAASLAEVESPEARGVLAATAVDPHPHGAERVELPGCDVVLTGDDRVALCTAGDGVELWDLAPPARRWRRPHTARAGLVVGARAVVLSIPGRGLLVLDPATGAERARFEVPHRTLTLLRDVVGDEVWFIDANDVGTYALSTGLVTQHVKPCGAVRIEAGATGGGLVALVCRDGQVVLAGDGAAFAAVGRSALGGATEVASALAVAADGRSLVLGGSRGSLQVIELAPWRARPARQIRDDRVTALEIVGDEVAVLGEHGPVALWPLAGDRPGLRLPIAAGRDLRHVGDHLISTGTAWWRWRRASALVSRGWSSPVGLTGLAVSPGGGVVAASHPDGTIDVWTRDRGLRSLSLPGMTARDVALDDAGDRLAVAISERPGLRLFSLATEPPTPLPVTDRPALRSVVFLGDGSLRGFEYGPTVVRWPAAGGAAEPGPSVNRARRLRGGDGLVAITDQGELVAIDPRGTTSLGRDDGGETVVGLPGGRMAVGHPGGVRVQADGAEQAWLATRGERVTDLDVSADGRWLAASTTDGAIRVWSTSTWALAAILRGHRQRVAEIAFADDGYLWSAAWDGQVRAWDLRSLDRPVAELRAEIEARWALPLAMVP